MQFEYLDAYLSVVNVQLLLNGVNSDRKLLFG